MRTPRTTILLALILLIAARCLLAAGPTVAVLGTGSATGTVVAAHPSATGTGKWFTVWPVTDQTRVACQVTAMGTNTLAIEASLDATNADTVFTFAADKKIHTFSAYPSMAYRGVVAGYTSGSPVVTCVVSGAGQIVVMP